MSGDQRGDFSRLPSATPTRYSGVYMQQGRVQLDSDWNALVETIAHRLRNQVRDLVGETGAPAGSSGFELVPKAALHFTGAGEYASLGAAPVELFAAAPALTLEAWVRPAEGGPGGTIVSRFDRRAPATALGHSYLVDVLADGRVRYHRAGGGELVSERPLAFGRWSHLALAHDAGRTLLYLDGEPAGVLEQGFTAAGEEALFLVGLAQLGAGDRLPFHGWIRELALWREVREPDAVRRDATGPLRGDESELLGHWRCDRKSGDVVLDGTSHGHHVVLGGGKPEARPRLDLEDLVLSAGRFYVGGRLCENPSAVPFAEQPDLPGAALPDDRSPGAAYLLYLEAWERTVTALEDPALEEVALGGVDTTVRGRLVAQARWLPLDLAELPSDPETLPDEWRELLRRGTGGGRLEARLGPVAPGALENRLYRVEIHSGGGTYGWPRRFASGERVQRVESVLPAVQQVVLEDEVDGLAVGDWVELYSDETDAAEGPGLVARIGELDAAARTLALSHPLDELAGHRRLQLRRIATFKWSRENGSVVLGVARLEEGGRVATLRSSRRRELPLAEGDWVELRDERSVLGGDVHSLLEVEALDPGRPAVTFGQLPAGGVGSEPKLRPVLVRWDQRGDAGAGLLGGALRLEASRWQRLEGGIEVRFSRGPFRRGDYWAFTSRRESSGIDWPRDEGGEPLPREPQGRQTLFAPLAVLRFDERGFELRDCRPTFQPLSRGAVSKAGDRMHGPLEIRADPERGPGLRVHGAAEADSLYGELGSPGAVATFNLAGGAVTRSKIAPDVGTVAPRHSILGEEPEAPPGYEPTGARLTVPETEPRWVTRLEVPADEEPGELRSAAAGGRVYTLSDSGRLWAYDPRGKKLERRTGPGEARSRFGLASWRDHLYVFGGIDDSGEKTASVLAYDPATDAWSRCADMPRPRSEVAVAAAGDRLFVLGGLRDWLVFELVSRRNEVYDPMVDSWTRRRSLPTARYRLGAAAAPTGLYAFGGEKRWFLRWLGRAVAAYNEAYLPDVDRWARRRSPMPAPLAPGGSARVAERIFVVGGRSLFGGTAEAVVYAPESDVWARAPALPTAAQSPGIAAIDGRLVAVTAGSTPGSLAVHECVIARSFWVHRKLAAPEGDLEPQLRLDERDDDERGDPG